MERDLRLRLEKQLQIFELRRLFASFIEIVQLQQTAFYAVNLIILTVRPFTTYVNGIVKKIFSF